MILRYVSHINALLISTGPLRKTGGGARNRLFIFAFCPLESSERQYISRFIAKFLPTSFNPYVIILTHLEHLIAMVPSPVRLRVKFRLAMNVTMTNQNKTVTILMAVFHWKIFSNLVPQHAQANFRECHSNGPFMSHVHEEFRYVSL
jgi:hypothetical protein